jgi:uncharacterized protein
MVCKPISIATGPLFPCGSGVIRVSSQPKYPNCLGTNSRGRNVLREFVKRGNTASCVKKVSLLDDEVILESSALTPSRVSDLYLLALAAANDARLATFDTRIPAAAVAGGSAALEIIPVS